MFNKKLQDSIKIELASNLHFKSSELQIVEAFTNNNCFSILCPGDCSFIKVHL